MIRRHCYRYWTALEPFLEHFWDKTGDAINQNRTSQQLQVLKNIIWRRISACVLKQFRNKETRHVSSVHLPKYKCLCNLAFWCNSSNVYDVDNNSHGIWGQFSPTWSLESIGFCSNSLFYKVYFQPIVLAAIRKHRNRKCFVWHRLLS